MQDPHQEFFDLIASEWDLMFTTEDLERLSHIVDRLEVRSDMNVIDLGCGTGILFDMIRRQVGPEGSVTGVDFSLQMVLKAHRNFPFSNVNCIDGDVIALPFRSDYFDMGVAFSAFPYFSDKQQAVDEVHRVLKKDARFYIIHLQSSKELSAIHQKIGGVVENDELPSAESLTEIFHNSKFANVVIDDQPGHYLATAVTEK
jgi:demethylmenaquinone methyltransferase/2-methoxy-6-polyprenyl-1,4-benzoquinol methylase